MKNEIVAAGFLGDTGGEILPNAHIQWKGTTVCMDFYCDCGAHCHFDGDFAHAVRCPHCRTIWEMPCRVYPRKVEIHAVIQANAIVKVMEKDED